MRRSVKKDIDKLKLYDSCFTPVDPKWPYKRNLSDVKNTVREYVQKKYNHKVINMYFVVRKYDQKRIKIQRIAE